MPTVAAMVAGPLRLVRPADTVLPVVRRLAAELEASFLRMSSGNRLDTSAMVLKWLALLVALLRPHPGPAALTQAAPIRAGRTQTLNLRHIVGRLNRWQ